MRPVFDTPGRSVRGAEARGDVLTTGNICPVYVSEREHTDGDCLNRGPDTVGTMGGKETGSGSIGGLGEIALRVHDLDEMQSFYEEVVGLELMRRFDRSAFFEIAPGFGGHTQILALFDRSGRADYTPPERARSTLDHLAFEIPLSAIEDERERLASNGIDVRETTFEWVQWRSLFFHDPEGNHVELVAYDPSIERRD